MINIKIKPIQGYQICPFCGGNVEYAGISSGHIFPDIHTGQMYVCRECGYHGGFIIEVDDLDDARNMKKALNTYRADFETHKFNFPDKWKWLWKTMLIFIIIFMYLGGLWIVFWIIGLF